MVKDKIWLSGLSVGAVISAVVASFVSNPIPNGVVAVTFALLAIAWAPRA